VPHDYTGAIDCDVHPRVPSIDTLRRYMDDYWAETVTVRGIDAFETIGWPASTEFVVRPEARGDVPGAKSTADTDVGRTAKLLLDRHGLSAAILNPLYAVQMIRDEYMAAAFARAVNEWVRHEWLDRDPRLKASIVVSTNNIATAVEEVERLAPDKRFVQVLLLASGEQPLGKSLFWPIYAACEKHGLAVGIHAGSSYHHAPTGSGWPSYYVEDYAATSLAFHMQTGSLISEGVFVKFPGLKAVMIESGVTWLAPYMWRLSKFWRGVRLEVPWVDRPPMEILRDHIRFTMQPFDAPDDPRMVERILDQLPSEEMLLFSSDYPHWQYDGDRLLPDGLDPGLARKVMVDNPKKAYPRLAGI
jgi:predicted TIM-barrel fold metal-dependent hydrolase